MAETLTTIKTRSSSRKFKNEPVKKEILDQILEAGTFAATGQNKQSPIIIVIEDREVRDRLAKINAEAMGFDGDPFYGAPVVVAVLADKSVRTYINDGSIVLANMMLAAEDLGIGNCWIHRAKEEFESEYGKELLAKLGIEGDYEGIGHLILGYAATPLNEAAPRKESYIYRV